MTESEQKHKIDPRRSGTHFVRVLTNGGESTQRIIINVSKWKGILGLVIAISVVAGGAGGLLRVAVEHEVSVYTADTFAKALKRPNGVITKEIDDSIGRHERYATEKYLGDMEAVRSTLKVIETRMEQADKERAVQHEELMRLLRGSR